jgi:hypothetical protein
MAVRVMRAARIARLAATYDNVAERDAAQRPMSQVGCTRKSAGARSLFVDSQDARADSVRRA